MVTITKRAKEFAAGGVIGANFGAGTPATGAGAYVISYPNFGNTQTKAEVSRNNITTGGTPAAGASKKDVWNTFKGITIPQGATINSAVLSIIVQKKGSGAFIMQANVWDSNDAFIGNPSTYPNAATIYSRFMAHTRVGGGNAPPLMMTTPTGTKREKVVFTRPTATSPTGWPNITTHDLDVKNMVQRLVNQWAYVNQSMTFQLTGDYPNPANPTNTKAEIYTDQMYTNGNFSPKVTPATSQGTSIMTPKLVIVFNVAATIDEEFTNDALLFLGAYLRSCSLVDSILIPTGPSHIGFEVAEAILAYLTANGDKTGTELMAEVINPTTGRPYTNHSIKNNIGYLESTNQITGNPFVPPPSETGAFNFKKTTWTIV